MVRAMTERKPRRPGTGGRLLLFCAIAWLSGLALAMVSEYHGQVTFGGLPLPGSTVTVTATQGDKTAVAITDSQGFYSFPDLADGKWTIAIEMTGFAPVKQEVTVAPNAAAGAFEMKLLSLEQMRRQPRSQNRDLGHPRARARQQRIRLRPRPRVRRQRRRRRVRLQRRRRRMRMHRRPRWRLPSRTLLRNRPTMGCSSMEARAMRPHRSTRCRRHSAITATADGRCTTAD